ncbi:MAG TPA: GNAT family N-acetyltransferase [Devosia sp.]|nr:GNAT family N-acetyltransferase [Devosia sp.]
MELLTRPATPARWGDLVTAMEGCSYGKSCWCAFWYLPNAIYRANGAVENRAHLEGLVRGGKTPGLIAYVDDAVAGWVGVAPRQRFDRLNRSKNFAAVDELEPWAVNCFIVLRPFRRQGMVASLAEAAAEYAFSKGAAVVEGYPMEPGEKTGSGDLFVGSVAAFVKAGYKEVARPLPRRAIMRKFRGTG